MQDPAAAYPLPPFRKWSINVEDDGCDEAQEYDFEAEREIIDAQSEWVRSGGTSFSDSVFVLSRFDANLLFTVSVRIFKHSLAFPEKRLQKDQLAVQPEGSLDRHSSHTSMLEELEEDPDEAMKELCDLDAEAEEEAEVRAERREAAPKQAST